MKQIITSLKDSGANITFAGDFPSSDGPTTTTVTYCSSAVNGVCGGDCTVYTGENTCLHAPSTKCLAATNNVGFCDKKNCKGSCHDLATCGDWMDNNFCYTPGTDSIVLPF